MTYDEALAFIHSSARFGTKPGLERISALCEKLGNPQDGMKYIHIAGTDGKGSTCAMLSSVLKHAGYKTGLFISPYVTDFRERIQLNGQMIPKEDLAELTEKLVPVWNEIADAGDPPTEFEIVTAIAFLWFAKNNCDIVILETGMGGRFDATNIITSPLCCVITRISYDHQMILGDTLHDIAYEKSGIIKTGSDVICYPDQRSDALKVVADTCKGKDAEFHVADMPRNIAVKLGGTAFSYKDSDYNLSLHGAHQALNAACVIEAFDVLARKGFKLSESDIKHGLECAHIPARIEVISRSPLVIVDGGHNIAETSALGSFLSLADGRKIHAVMGMLADKDVGECAENILPHCEDVAAVAIDDPRALAADELAAVASKHCTAKAYDDHTAAIKDTIDKCGKNDLALICGSLYLAAELRGIALEILNNKQN
jgi:dihydrofolate synthase/folylpolyglutamate synthase